MRHRLTFWRRSVGLAGIAITTLAATAQWSVPNIPAFHQTAPPETSLPHLLAESERQGVYFSHPYQQVAYTMADRVPQLLYQMPCYCRCDLAMRHRSLHSCFEGTHAAVCTTCMSEAAYVYQESKKGRTATQVRAGIERGDWQEIDLETIHMD